MTAVRWGYAESDRWKLIADSHESLCPVSLAAHSVDLQQPDRLHDLRIRVVFVRLHLLRDEVDDRGELYHAVNPPGLEKLDRSRAIILDKSELGENQDSAEVGPAEELRRGLNRFRLDEVQHLGEGRDGASGEGIVVPALHLHDGTLDAWKTLLVEHEIVWRVVLVEVQVVDHQIDVAVPPAFSSGDLVLDVGPNEEAVQFKEVMHDSSELTGQ